MKQQSSSRQRWFFYVSRWKIASRLLLLTILSFFSTSVFCQKLISGTVTADSITPLTGVTVEIKGSTAGTTTDQNGKYSITVGDEAVLVFRLAGYVTQEINVNGRTVVDVSMQTAAPALTTSLPDSSESIERLYDIFRRDGTPYRLMRSISSEK